MTAETWQAE